MINEVNIDKKGYHRCISAATADRFIQAQLNNSNLLNNNKSNLTAVRDVTARKDKRKSCLQGVAAVRTGNVAASTEADNIEKMEEEEWQPLEAENNINTNKINGRENHWAVSAFRLKRVNTSNIQKLFPLSQKLKIKKKRRRRRRSGSLRKQ